LVLGWLRKNPKSFGFPTELWTGQRIATLIQKKFKVRYHPRYICEWLVSKNFSPQKPRTKPHERDDPAIAHWLKHDLPRIQNEPGAETHISS
jgi:transposase